MKTSDHLQDPEEDNSATNRPGRDGMGRIFARGLPVVSAIVVLVMLTAGRSVAQEGVTIAALNIAYDRECNSRQQYLMFATRAEAEGHPVAALAFQTAAMAESVHAAHFAVQIVALGHVPAWTDRRVRVRDTVENLCQAIADEIAENQYIYRQLIAQSRSEGHHAPLLALDHARRSEATHAGMFAEVLQDFEAIEAPAMICDRVAGTDEEGEAIYHVCMGDGSVFTHGTCGACPNCAPDDTDLRPVGCIRRPAGGRQGASSNLVR